MSNSTKTGITPFIVSTGLHQVDQDTRKLIRKHVMLRKNTGKGSKKHRHSNGRRRRSPPVLIPLAIAPHPGDTIDTFPSTLPSSYPASIPQRVGSDGSCVQFADVVESSTASLVLRFSAVAKQTLFPLETCIMFDKQEGRQWLELMAFDPIFLHTMIFTTLSYHDSLRRYERVAPTNTQLSLHFTKALRLLRERLILQNDDTKFSDITLSTVLGLAVYAYLSGEREAAEYHLSALRTIIDFRGGLRAFINSGKILFELFRCDLGLALNHGSTTFFFTNTSVEPFPPYPERDLLLALGCGTIDAQINQDHHVDELDCDLAKAYSIVNHFSMCIKLAHKTKNKLPKELILDAMASIMYRLMHMSYRHGSLNECKRLGLLAYSSSIFLQWRDTRMSYDYFSNAYSDCLISSDFSDKLPTPFQFWLLMTGAVSIFKEHDDKWLKPLILSTVNSCNLYSWDQARVLLNSIMWIDLLHDHVGKMYFDSIVGDVSTIDLLQDAS